MGDSTMFKMQKDETKYSAEYIEKNPGRLAAQIVWNRLVDNEMFVWILGNIQGNRLFTVSLNNGQESIIGFTDFDLLTSYVNRNKIRKNLLTNFGKKIVLLNVSFKHLMRILTTTPGSRNTMEPAIDTIIINPNNRDFFIPMNIGMLSKVVENNVDEIERDTTDMECVTMAHNSKIKLFEEIEEEEEDNEKQDFY